jgi:predicted DNA-binding transcriptional regulator AlpA
MLLTEREVAERIRKSLSWLQHMRQTGGGPLYLKLGHAVRYRDEDVVAWLEQQVRRKVWEFDNNDAFELIGDAADRAVSKLERGRS